MRLNKNPGLLRLGDAVVTDIHGESCTIVRHVVKIELDSDCGSGLLASADGGEPCPTCGHTPGKPIGPVDGAWFIPLGDAENEGGDDGRQA